MGLMDNFDKMIHGWIERAIDATMPRQAIVTRSDVTGVWVRFTPVDATVPEMWFPGSGHRLPAGTSGWVHPLAGGKGRFIADGLMYPIVDSASAGVTLTVSTAGSDMPVGTTNVGANVVTVSGLDPNRWYRVKVEADIRAIAASAASASFGATIEHSGGFQFSLDYSQAVTNSVHFYGSTYSWRLKPKADGTFVIRPAVKWASGSISITAGYVTATITGDH